MKISKWYGPFEDASSSDYMYFITAADTGHFDGLIVDIWFKEQAIYLSYYNNEGGQNADQHTFT